RRPVSRLGVHRERGEVPHRGGVRARRQSHVRTRIGGPGPGGVGSALGDRDRASPHDPERPIPEPLQRRGRGRLRGLAPERIQPSRCLNPVPGTWYRGTGTDFQVRSTKYSVLLTQASAWVSNRKAIASASVALSNAPRCWFSLGAWIDDRGSPQPVTRIGAPG